jgi:hypothetical protein
LLSRVHDQLLQAGEQVAVPVPGQRQQLLVAQPRPTRDLRGQIDAELAADQCGGLQLGQNLQPPGEAVQLGGGLL